jgi:hypothetical protein
MSKTLQSTMTGEHFQPVRLHYDLRDPQGWIKASNRLRCIARDGNRDAWVWLYDHEAKSVGLKVAFRDIPKERRPVVIGRFYRRERELLLDVRSCERAVAAIPFFDRHIPRAVAYLTDAEIVNRLFECDPSVTPESIFDGGRSVAVDGEAILKEVTAIAARGADPDERLDLALEFLRANASKPMPQIERLPVNYYEDGGLGGFILAMRLRQIVARQHWLGNASFTMRDALAAVVPGAQRPGH